MERREKNHLPRTSGRVTVRSESFAPEGRKKKRGFDGGGIGGTGRKNQGRGSKQCSFGPEST